MTHAILSVVIAAAVTLILRFLPFLFFGGKRKIPAYINYLGTVLPSAIMAMLVVFCLKNVSFSALAGWLPPLIGCAVVAALHLWKRNTLLSIVGGTVCYMFLVQVVF